MYNDTELQNYSKLVISIKEYDEPIVGNDTENTDMSMYIYFDETVDNYVLFGRRSDRKDSKNEFVPFRFQSKSKRELVHFIMLVIDPETRVSFEIYNYNNLGDYDFQEITYEFMEDNVDSQYEICAYDNYKLGKKTLYKHLSLLSSFFN